MTQRKNSDSIDSPLGPSPEPDPEGAKFHERDAAGNLVETRPKHHVDPLARTEAVSGAAKPKTLRECVRSLPRDRKVTFFTSGGHKPAGRVVEVTDEVLFLEGDQTIVLDKIDLYFIHR
jgi:hypothetical protein